MSGKLIVLEGIDGSGKSTQYARLCQRLEEDGVKFKRLVFPRYDNPSSSLVKMYLSGDFGKSPSAVNPYAASAFYAVDRFASYKTDWEDWYGGGGLVLSDRYTTSNACHQGSKLAGDELCNFLDWLCNFEYNQMELPRPEIVIYLDTELQIALNQLGIREKGGGDIHEKDLEYMRKTLETGRFAARYYGWQRVESVKNGEIRAVSDIHEEIYSIISRAIF